MIPVKDYYQILGIKRNSTEQEINLAYNKISAALLSRKSDDDKSIEDKLKEIQEAYETLTNQNKRGIYDSMLRQFNPYELIENQNSNINEKDIRSEVEKRNIENIEDAKVDIKENKGN